jgi:hypothetical protein
LGLNGGVWVPASAGSVPNRVIAAAAAAAAPVSFMNRRRETLLFSVGIMFPRS